MRTSSNNGASYDSGGSDYVWGNLGNRYDLSTLSTTNSNGDSKVPFGSFLGTGATEFSSLDIELYNLSQASRHDFFYKYTAVATGGVKSWKTGTATRNGTLAINAIEFSMDSGNINFGEFKLYGLKA